jgi:hypothetical protein
MAKDHIHRPTYPDPTSISSLRIAFAFLGSPWSKIKSNLSASEPCPKSDLQVLLYPNR